MVVADDALATAAAVSWVAVAAMVAVVVVEVDAAVSAEAADRVAAGDFGGDKVAMVIAALMAVEIIWLGSVWRLWR